MNYITTQSQVNQAVSKLINQSKLYLDLETMPTKDHPFAGLLPIISDIRLVQIADDNGETYVFDKKYVGLDWIRPLLDKDIYGYNLLFDVRHLLQAGYILKKPHCLMLLIRCINGICKSGYAYMSLKEAVSKYLQQNISKTEQISDWSSDKLTSEQLAYAAEDVRILPELHLAITESIRYSSDLDTIVLLDGLILPTARQLNRGIRFDWDNHSHKCEKSKKEHLELSAQLKELGLNDPTNEFQKQGFIASKITTEERQQWPRTKLKGLLATSYREIYSSTTNKDAHLLADYLKINDFLTHYGDKFNDHNINGYVYPDYRIAAMHSGRFGCNRPNFQNLPRSGFKHLILAPDGHQFVTGDLSQVELRVMALTAKDKTLLDGYKNGIDLHRSMAARLFNVPISQVTKEQRTIAKGVNFGLLYGSGAPGLRRFIQKSCSKRLNQNQAQKYIKIFQKTYPKVYEWQRQVVRDTNKSRASFSPFSQIRRSYDQDVYTHAMNHPIQSAAFEILALAIIYIDHYTPESIWISHHVYDELTLVARDDKVVEAAHLLKAGFEHGYRKVFPDCDVTGIIEVGAGKNWAEAGKPENIIDLSLPKVA